jgi:uncharacterized protein YdeI (YjbR/CyaY-like superfamily)
VALFYPSVTTLSKPPNRTPQKLPIVFCASALIWRRWLDKNHARSGAVWLRIAKKSSEERSITYAEALDEALCYGWIDGQKQTHDRSSWLQWFGPRKTGSAWSKTNTEHAQRLIKAGKMKPAGRREVEAAKRDGRWKQAYDSSARATPPEDFLRALAKNPKAKAFFETLEKRNSYAIIYRLQTAKKPETRAKRMQIILEMLAKGKKFHP